MKKVLNEDFGIAKEHEDYVSSADICRHLKISRSTLEKLRDHGMPFLKFERTYRYKISDVVEHLKSLKGK